MIEKMIACFLSELRNHLKSRGVSKQDIVKIIPAAKDLGFILSDKAGLDFLNISYLENIDGSITFIFKGVSIFRENKNNENYTFLRTENTGKYIFLRYNAGSIGYLFLAYSSSVFDMILKAYKLGSLSKDFLNIVGIIGQTNLEELDIAPVNKIFKGKGLNFTSNNKIPLRIKEVF